MHVISTKLADRQIDGGAQSRDLQVHVEMVLPVILPEGSSLTLCGVRAR